MAFSDSNSRDNYNFISISDLKRKFSNRCCSSCCCTFDAFCDNFFCIFVSKKKYKREKCLPIFVDRVAFISSHSSTLEEQDVEREIGQGQFHQCANAQLLRSQIPKVQKNSPVIRRKKVDQLVELLYFGGFALYAVRSRLMKLTLNVKKLRPLNFKKFQF